MADGVATSPGLELLLDVFRRADKNDDGKISLEEFRNYFDDGILSGEQVEELFETIDVDKSENIDHEELCKWFSGGLVDAYAELFEAVAAASAGVTASLTASAGGYAEQSVLEQYRTRFLLREAYLQIEALKAPLEHAVDSLEDRARLERELEIRKGLGAPGAGAAGASARGAVGGPPGVRVPAPTDGFTYRTSTPPQSPSLRSVGFGAGAVSGGASASDVGALAEQIDRLKAYVDNYVSRFEFNVVEEGDDDEEDEAVMIVMRVFDVDEDDVDAFVAAASTYMRATRQDVDGCLHLYFKRQAGNASRIMFWEVWESPDELTDHYCGPVWRSFVKETADTLISPTETKQLPVPASWWPAALE